MKSAMASPDDKTRKDCEEVCANVFRSICEGLTGAEVGADGPVGFDIVVSAGSVIIDVQGDPEYVRYIVGKDGRTIDLIQRLVSKVASRFGRHRCLVNVSRE